MELRFSTLVEDRPGTQWQSLFQALWPAYERWYLSEGVMARPTWLACHRAMKTHMPELLPLWEELCELAGGSDLAARFLSFWNPPPYISSCSQAVWPGSVPMLVRNYDYDAKRADGVILDTCWRGAHRVVATGDGLWGALDGMNDQGLAISLTFGGRRPVGEGFGIPLILRYILEVCTNTGEAVNSLKRIPCHMAYNITCVDSKRQIATVFLSPDRPATVTRKAVATNHQESVELPRYARMIATVEREQFLLNRISRINESAGDFIGHFLRPPLYSLQFARGFGTLYTAVFWPTLGYYEYHWPGVVWAQRLGETLPNSSRLIHYPI